MLATLRNERLILREIKNFSEEKSNVKNRAKRNTKNESHLLLRIVNLLFKITMSLGKIAFVNVQLSIASIKVNSKIKSDYKLFLKSNEGQKEDLLVKWEKLSRALNSHSNHNLNENHSLTKGVVSKTIKIIQKVNSFSGKLREELYSNINQNYSQEYLEKLSKNFEHLPKDIMDDLTSEQHLECV